MVTAYYGSYGLVSAQRAEYVCSKTKALLTTIYATIGERFELKWPTDLKCLLRS
jgi:hypothetical protein